MNRVAQQTGETQASTNTFLTFAILGLMPLAAVLIPWDFGPTETPLRQFMARNSLAVPCLFFLLLVTVMRGLVSPADILKPLNKLDKFVIGAFLASLTYASLFVATDHRATLVGIISFYLLIIMVIGIKKLLMKAEERDLEAFWQITGVATVAYALTWAISYSIHPPVEDDWIHRIPGVTNIRWTGFFWLAIYSAGMVFVGRKAARWPLIAMLYGSFGLTMAIWTGSRGVIVAIVAGTVAAIILSAKFRKWLVQYFFFCSVLASSINLVLPVPHEQYGLSRILASTEKTERRSGIDSGRLKLWGGTIDLAKQHPLTGHGIEQFQAMGPKETLGFRGPHSFPLQLLFSAGLIGVLALVYALFKLGTKITLVIVRPHQICALIFATGGAFYCLYDNFLYYPFPITVFLISLIMILFAKENAEKDQKFITE